jgi:hypothetical protein
MRLSPGLAYPSTDPRALRFPGKPLSDTDVISCGSAAVQPSLTTHARLGIAMMYAGIPS